MRKIREAVLDLIGRYYAWRKRRMAAKHRLWLYRNRVVLPRERAEQWLAGPEARVAMSKKRSVKPHHSARRNGTEAVTS